MGLIHYVYDIRSIHDHDPILLSIHFAYNLSVIVCEDFSLYRELIRYLIA